ncbi:hypothetical protein Dimus_020047 [Dionaea muscipula]
MSDPSRPATGYPAPHPTAADGYPVSTTITTAYPYAAPPPPQPSGYYYPNQNPNPYYSPSFVTHHAVFFRRFLAFVISLLAIFAVILLVVWLALRPRLPVFRVDSLSLTGFNISSSSSQLSGDCSVRFTVSNPNTKLHAYYDENQLPPFNQATKTLTDLTAELVASSAYVPSSVTSRMTAERNQGILHFNVNALAVVRFKAGAWRVRRRRLRVLCSNLSVAVPANSANGTLTGGPRDCSSVL